MRAEERRRIATAAARSQIRRLNIEPSLENAEGVLDEMARTEPDLVASQWWLTASENQYRLFHQEWRRT